MVNIVAPDKRTTQRWAQEGFKDNNSLHAEDNRKQNVPGDGLFGLLLENGLLIPGNHYTLSFDKEVRPEQELNLSETGIESDSFQRVLVSKKPLVSEPMQYNDIPKNLIRLEGMLDTRSALNEFFPNMPVPIELLAHYGLISNDVSSNDMQRLYAAMKELGLSLPKPGFFMYKQTDIDLFAGITPETTILGRVPTTVSLGEYNNRPMIGFEYVILDNTLREVAITTKYVLNPRFQKVENDAESIVA